MIQKNAANILELFQDTLSAWFRDNASRQAAALAYYGILSLAPLLIIAISVAGIFLGRADIKQQVIQEVTKALGSGSGDLVKNVLDATYSGGSGLLATVLSVFLLMFAATNIFFQLKTSLNRIWGVQYDEEKNALLQDILRLIGDRFIAALMVLGVGFALLLFQALGAVLSVLISVVSTLPVNTTFLLHVLNLTASIGFTAMVISLIFRFLPDKRLAWSEVWVGALFTAVLFAVGQRAISLYLENSSVASAYGVAGSLIVVLLWIYYSAMILLFGAEFTQAYARLHEDTQGVQANPH